MKSLVITLSVVALVLGGVGSVFAASNFYGMSGLIETPGDCYVPQLGVAVTANYATGFGDNTGNLSTFGGAFGLLPNLEISGVVADSSSAFSDTAAVLNAKYRIMPETADRPAINIGVVDVLASLDDINPGLDDSPSAYLMFSKNITRSIEGMSGAAMRPLWASAGFGSGIYKGAFVGLNYSATSRFDLIFEYLSNGIQGDTTFNGGIRYFVTPNLSLKAGAMDFSDFFVGGTYVISSY